MTRALPCALLALGAACGGDGGAGPTDPSDCLDVGAYRVVITRASGDCGEGWEEVVPYSGMFDDEPDDGCTLDVTYPDTCERFTVEDCVDDEGYRITREYHRRLNSGGGDGFAEFTIRRPDGSIECHGTYTISIAKL